MNDNEKKDKINNDMFTLLASRLRDNDNKKFIQFACTLYNDCSEEFVTQLTSPTYDDESKKFAVQLASAMYDSALNEDKVEDYHALLISVIRELFLFEKLNFEKPVRQYEPDDLQDTPVNPQQLAIDVCDKLSQHGNVVPNRTEQTIEEICKCFNTCILENNSEETSFTKFILSPKTGSAKSLTTKCYISKLESTVKSLVIVSKVDDAIEFCTDICLFSNDMNKARCYYNVSDKNPTSPYRATKDELLNVNCLVVTHAMFKTLLSSKTILDELIIQDSNRKTLYDIIIRERGSSLMVVDERIDLYAQYTITLDNIVDMLTLLRRVTKHDVSDSIECLEEIVDYFELIESYAQKNTLLVDVDSYMQEYDEHPPTINLKSFELLLQNQSVDLYKIFNSIQERSSDTARTAFVKKLEDKIHHIKKIFEDGHFFYNKSGKIKSMITVHSIYYFPKSMVVLDATANINALYDTMKFTKCNSFRHIETTDTRIYSNLTVNVAYGYPQGKDAIYNGLNSNDLITKAKQYLNVAEQLLTTTEDKLLIVTFEKFKLKMESQSTNKNIKFTHWGNHVGKNKWSDCNKVMIIGWHRLPESVHYCNLINAVGSQKDIMEYESLAEAKDPRAYLVPYARNVIDKLIPRIKNNIHNKIEDLEVALKSYTNISKYKQTQIVDDLVQASMRGSARITDSDNGDCKKSEIYLFASDSNESRDIINLYMNEFKGATLSDWKPSLGSVVNHKRAKSTNNVELIETYLLSKEKSFQDVLQSTIAADTGMHKMTLSRTLTSKKFQEVLDKNGWSYQSKDNKQKAVFFSNSNSNSYSK